MRFCEQTDLENALGGAAQLRELLDKDRDGYADINLVGVALDDASIDISTALAVNLQLGAGPLRAPYAPALVSRAAHCAAYHAWLIGTDGQSVPRWIAERRDNAVRWAERAGLRELTLGTVAPPPAAQGPRLVDPDPQGESISRRAFRQGFC